MFQPRWGYGVVHYSDNKDVYFENYFKYMVMTLIFGWGYPDHIEVGEKVKKIVMYW